MINGSNTTPLIALDAVVIDTETTGLNPSRARLVEAAAVRIVKGRLVDDSTFLRLVHPGVPIPAASTAIHGIDDDAVAKAADFRATWPALSAFIGDEVVIGHSIGFDLAVLKRECERAGLAWQRPRSLCVRLLGEFANSDLAGYSLDELAAWLGVTVAGRHRALPDAIVTARVFVALLPRLRDRGVRTLAEAEQACLGLSHAMEHQRGAGWVDAVAAPRGADAEAAFGRVDVFPYRHRVADVMGAPPRFIVPDALLRDASRTMTAERISSLLVSAAGAHGGPPPWPRDCGIITERDILRALAEHGADALAMPVSRAASRPLQAVPADAFVYRAIARMNRLKVRHLGAVDEDGRVCGVLSSRDLLRLRAEEATELGDEIDQAADVHDLATAWAKLALAARGLVAEGVEGRDVAAVLAQEIGELTRHAAILAEQRLQAEGFGSPPCPYAVAVLGSAGRGESLLAMDQDNAIVFADGEPGGDADRWFERLGLLVADMLHETGVPYCKGGVMARNPQWRGSLATWHARIGHWISRSSPQDLLSVDIFFDLRGVHGDLELANALWRHGFDTARGQVDFAKLLADSAGPVPPAFSLFGAFKTEQGRLDLKATGLFGIVSLARVLAIRHHVVERSTLARLAGMAALGIEGSDDLDGLANAHAGFIDSILKQQLEDIGRGLPATNGVVVKRLSKSDRERLRQALEQVRHLDELARDLLFRN